MRKPQVTLRSEARPMRIPDPPNRESAEAEEVVRRYERLRAAGGTFEAGLRWLRASVVEVA